MQTRYWPSGINCYKKERCHINLSDALVLFGWVLGQVAVLVATHKSHTNLMC